MTTDIEQQLRRAFEHRAQQTAVGNDVDPDQNAPMHWSATMARSWPRHAGVAVAAVLVVVGLVALGAMRRDQDSPTEQTPTAPVETAPSTTMVTAAQNSPFVGAWVSTDTDGSPQTMYIDQWGPDTYQVRVRNEAATVCEGVGRLATDTSLVVARLVSSTHHVSSCDETSFLPSPETELVLTHDPTTPADQFVDSLGVVWREQVAPPPDAGDVAVLDAFLGARVAGEGAEVYVGRGFNRDDRVPLLYATTSGAAYERFEIERVQDPDRTAKYNVRLFTGDGTVVQQRFMVQSVVVYQGPTLEDGQAVLLPFSILDGDVRFGVTSKWEVESFGDTHMAFWHRFGSSSIVIAAEPLAVGGACGTLPAPANAEELARIIAGSEHEVTEPVPLRIAGLDGLQIDVAVSDQQSSFLCTFEETGTLVGVQSGGSRMRLFLIDHPDESARVLTIAVMTSPEEFDDAIAETAPIIDSVGRATPEQPAPANPPDVATPTPAQTAGMTRSLDPDGDAATPLRVTFQVPTTGWAWNWFGAVKYLPGSADGITGLSITTISNLATDGCRDHTPLDPPVGPTVDDLATALSQLAPFEVTEPPTDITLFGYQGKHLALTVPALTVTGAGAASASKNIAQFTDCVDGELYSWISPINVLSSGFSSPGLLAHSGDSHGAFNAYQAPGQTEEFWILDVEGTRIVLVSFDTPGAPADDIAARDAIFESIRFEP